jgi:hypothetical protein
VFRLSANLVWDLSDTCSLSWPSFAEIDNPCSRDRPSEGLRHYMSEY